MACDHSPRLYWTQRIALVRHNLHAARRTNDFSFFKSLQAHALIEGVDHVAILYAALGDSADSVLSTLDNLNAGIAYVHQDAFKAVYDSIKTSMHTGDDFLLNRQSLVRVDISQQRDMADHAIDKTANSVVTFIQAQPIHCQDAVANAWITGTTIIADAVSVCLNEMMRLEDCLDDFIRLEYSWNCIQSSTDAAISALRGIFSLMSIANATNNQPHGCNGNGHRHPSISSTSSENAPASIRSRTSSSASAFSGFIKRALSHGQLQPPPVAATTTCGTQKQRSGSVLSIPEANSRGFRASMSAACPTKMPTFGDHPHTILTTIPPTPMERTISVMSSRPQQQEEKLLSPFKDSSDYFAFDMEKAKGGDKEVGGGVDDLMQIESLDPLYSPAPDDVVVKMSEPLALRRLSEVFEVAPNAAITV